MKIFMEMGECNHHGYESCGAFAIFCPTGREPCWVSARWGSPSSWAATLCWGPSYSLALKEVISSCYHHTYILTIILIWPQRRSFHPHDYDHNNDNHMTGGVGRMPSSQAAHGRNSPTVMNSTTLLGTLPSEVIIIFTMIFVMIRDANLPPQK